MNFDLKIFLLVKICPKNDFFLHSSILMSSQMLIFSKFKKPKCNFLRTVFIFNWPLSFLKSVQRLVLAVFSTKVCIENRNLSKNQLNIWKFVKIIAQNCLNGYLYIPYAVDPVKIGRLLFDRIRPDN